MAVGFMTLRPRGEEVVENHVYRDTRSDGWRTAPSAPRLRGERKPEEGGL